MSALSDKIEAGDRVQVPWGLEEVPGRVVEVYGTGDDRRAVVSIAVPGAAGEDLGDVVVTFPLSSLEPPGLLDLMVDIEDHLPRVGPILGEAAAVIERVGATATRYNDLLNQISSAANSTKSKLANLADFAKEIEPDSVRLDQLSYSFGEEIEAIEPNIMAILAELKSDLAQATQQAEFLASMKRLANASAESLEGTVRFYDSMAKVLNLSRTIRPKIRLLRSATLRIIAYQRRVASWVSPIEEILQSAS